MSARMDGEKVGGGGEEAERLQQEGLRGGEDGAGMQTEAVMEMLSLPPLMIHVALVLIVGWIASLYKLNLLFVFTLGFAYVCYIESRQRRKIETGIRSDERKATDRKRLLSDAETARWLNSVVESVWPIFLQNFASEHFLMRIAPWFLKKFKPWTANKVVLQKLYLGRSPPVFTFLRAGRHPTDGDHLVLEMMMNFAAAKDMHAEMAVQMRKRVGFGIWTSFHISNIQIEGNLRVGVRFRKGWPVIERLRICFSDAPIVRMVAKPVFSYGVDVTDLPGIAAWLDKMIIDALENSLVEPNLLVVDVEKLVGDLMSVYSHVRSAKHLPVGSSPRREWFHVGKKGSVATVLVEILKGEQMKACDPNGKSDPYVKIAVGQTEITTSVKKKTLEPEWHEQFRIPVENWTTPLCLRVRDKDRFLDDEMGNKQISLVDMRDGQRHEMCVQLDNVKTGRLHIAITVEETPILEDKSDPNLHSLQREDSRRGAVTSSPAGSIREGSDRARPESNGEVSGSDLSDETPLKDASEAVDVGVGESGCVSIVNPGRHVVKEAYSTERLRQRNTGSRKGSIERERESEGPFCQEDELDDLKSDAVGSSGGSKRARVRNLLRRKSQQGKKDASGDDFSGELSPEANELVIVGNRGSEVHMTLELDDEDVENLEASGMQDELPIVPESCELQRENGDVAPEDIDRRKAEFSRMKKMGRGIFKQTGKIGNNIGQVYNRSSSR